MFSFFTSKICHFVVSLDGSFVTIGGESLLSTSTGLDQDNEERKALVCLYTYVNTTQTTTDKRKLQTNKILKKPSTVRPK